MSSRRKSAPRRRSKRTSPLAKMLGAAAASLVLYLVAVAELPPFIADLIEPHLPSQTAPASRSEHADSTDLPCPSPHVVDGDTLRCGEIRIRLAGIDTPEMPGHCRQGRDCTPGDPYAAKAHLQQIVSRGALRCTQQDVDHYGRSIARCTVGDMDLSCEQLRSGHAVARYGRIDC